MSEGQGKIICPHCKTASGLYREMEEDGFITIHCCNLGCNYKSEPISYHSETGIPSMQELKDKWQ